MDKRKLLKLEQILNVKNKKDYFIVFVKVSDNELSLKSIYECNSKRDINIIRNERFKNEEEIYKKYEINPGQDKIMNMVTNKSIWGADD